tara:strand:+ start:843 stop:1727 length:885 start_codon:yes stop_codon:yes gene_type:complete
MVTHWLHNSTKILHEVDMKEIKIASLFAGIGGFDLGITRAIDKTNDYTARTIWQCEIDTYCQSILKRHWPHATLYPDIRTINPDTIEQPDIILSSFPCQDISCAGKGEGINGKNTGLYWHAHRLIKTIRPSIVIMENVPAITWRGRGGIDVIESLADIGYDAEWTIVSAQSRGANHVRKRWFLVAYPADTIVQRGKEQPISTCTMGSQQQSERRGSTSSRIHPKNHWQNSTTQPSICGMDDGLSGGMDRHTNRHRMSAIKALGNAIVPQCAEHIGDCIVQSGLLNTITNQGKEQ